MATHFALFYCTSCWPMLRTLLLPFNLQFALLIGASILVKLVQDDLRLAGNFAKFLHSSNVAFTQVETQEQGRQSIIVFDPQLLAMELDPVAASTTQYNRTWNLNSILTQQQEQEEQQLEPLVLVVIIVFTLILILITHTYTHSHIHTHIHTHNHTYTCTQNHTDNHIHN